MAYVKDGSVYVPLQKSSGRKRMFAIVDEADFERVARYKWMAVSGGRTFYVCATSLSGLPQHHLHMHSFILRVEKGQRVDHRNGNGLDNRKENLRPATTQENNQNRSKYESTSSRFKGVRPARDGRWVAAITLDKKSQVLGVFDAEEDAAIAYDAAAVRLFGEFAKTNKEMGLFESGQYARSRHGVCEDTRKLGQFLFRESDVDRKDVGVVIGLARHQRTKAILYRLDTGRRVNPKDYIGRHPTKDEYAAMRKALADYELNRKASRAAA